ncbi:MAG: hypothetical protein ACLUTA_12610 [Blautia wexlerae]
MIRRNVMVDITELIPSADRFCEKSTRALKNWGRITALSTNRLLRNTDNASPVFGRSRAVSPSTKTILKT